MKTTKGGYEPLIFFSISPVSVHVVVMAAGDAVEINQEAVGEIAVGLVGDGIVVAKL